MAGREENAWLPVFAKWSCFLMFIGHAWIHLAHSIPISDLIWKQEWMEPPASNLFGMTWSEWTSSSLVENGMAAFTRCVGVFYLGCALGCITRLPRAFVTCWMLAATAALFGLAFLKYLSGNMQIGHLLEQSCQVAMPITFLAIAIYRCRCAEFARWLRVPIALTFIFHGLFAVGFSADVSLPVIGALDYSVPGNFLEMTQNCLGIESETTARRVLLAAGVLDFVAAILLFVPRAAVWGLAYMIPWGFLTALARPWSHFDRDFPWETLSRWVPEMLFRIPHFGLPIVLLGMILLLRKK